MADDPLRHVRMQVSLRVAEIRAAGPRTPTVDLYAKIDAIRRIATDHGLHALEGLARRTAQLALLPGHRVTVSSCLEHVDEALDSSSERDCTAILAAVALRLH